MKEEKITFVSTFKTCLKGNKSISGNLIDVDVDVEKYLF